MRKFQLETDGSKLEVTVCELSLFEVKAVLDILLKLLEAGQFPISAASLKVEDKNGL